jgi:hypothetical protein
MDFKLLLSLIGTFIACASFGFVLFDRSKKRFDEIRNEFKLSDLAFENDVEAIRISISNLDGRIKVAETQMAVFWKGVGYSAAAALHSPHTPDLDKLLEGFVNESLIPMEKLKLQTMLLEIANDSSEPIMRKYLSREILLVMAVLEHYETFPLPNLGKFYGSSSTQIISPPTS